jgi:hypothetical protein
MAVKSWSRVSQMMMRDYGNGVQHLQFNIEDIYEQMDPQCRGKRSLFQSNDVKRLNELIPYAKVSVKINGGLDQSNECKPCQTVLGCLNGVKTHLRDAHRIHQSMVRVSIGSIVGCRPFPPIEKQSTVVLSGQFRVIIDRRSDRSFRDDASFRQFIRQRFYGIQIQSR